MHNQWFSRSILCISFLRIWFFMIYWIVRVRLNLVCSLETKPCLSCYPVWFFQTAKVLQLSRLLEWYNFCIFIKNNGIYTTEINSDEFVKSQKANYSRESGSPVITHSYKRYFCINFQDLDFLRIHQLWWTRKKSKSCHSRAGGSL